MKPGIQSAQLNAMNVRFHGVRPAIDLARQSFNLILGFGLSIPVFFVTSYAWVMWFVIPLVVSRWRRHHRRSPPDGPDR